MECEVWSPKETDRKVLRLLAGRDIFCYMSSQA